MLLTCLLHSGIFFFTPNSTEWREAGLARDQIGCPSFICGCANVLVWASLHSLCPCARAPQARPGLVAACFSATRRPAKQFSWKVSAHCCIVVACNDVHKWFGKESNRGGWCFFSPPLLESALICYAELCNHLEMCSVLPHTSQM